MDTCHKVPYSTYGDAQAALSRAKTARRRGSSASTRRQERNAYRCECGAWHLTSWTKRQIRATQKGRRR